MQRLRWLIRSNFAILGEQTSFQILIAGLDERQADALADRLSMFLIEIGAARRPPASVRTVH